MGRNEPGRSLYERSWEYRMAKMDDYKFANLNGEQLTAVKKLEGDLNKEARSGGEIIVIAYQVSPQAGTNPPGGKL